MIWLLAFNFVILRLLWRELHSIVIAWSMGLASVFFACHLVAPLKISCLLDSALFLVVIDSLVDFYIADFMTS